MSIVYNACILMFLIILFRVDSIIAGTFLTV